MLTINSFTPPLEGSELIVLVPFRVRVIKDDQFADQVIIRMIKKQINGDKR